MLKKLIRWTTHVYTADRWKTMIGCRSWWIANCRGGKPYGDVAFIESAMGATNNLPPLSLGLGGDGDEIAAIEEVERCFGVRLDYNEAQHWTTVGDVFAALQQALPFGQTDASANWQSFTQAISGETGVDPSKVTTDTLLLGQSHFDWRVATAVGLLIGLGLAAAHFWGS